VQDRSSEEELARLQLQDQMLTASMGGVLVEQPDPALFQRVLDVGCGTGGWLIETAKTYPAISLLIGVDVSRRMLDYAQAQASAQQVDERIEFRVMDALRMLEFPSDFFDLVNQRLGQSYVRTWEWPKLLQEYVRVTRPEGVIRLTELVRKPESSSNALNSLNQLGLQALYQAGNALSAEPGELTLDLVSLLSLHGIQSVQTYEYSLEYRAGTREGQFFIEDMQRLYRTLLPFLRKWIHVPDDYEALYQQALDEMQQPDFFARWRLLTAWGTKSL
jgi:ubiquinone/menaquinone biosynthesis C-methylase UbiE